MQRDEDIAAAATQLAQFRKANELGNILDKYEELIKDFQRLKSDYEEERDAREKYKQLARSREQNPFALVLVDGDGYIFSDAFISERGGEGGNNAAHALNSAVASSLKDKGLDGLPVMVRVYANVQGLSKVLARNGLVGHEARSLSPFIANFNRSYGLTEFIDAGNLKENADFKLRALLRFYAEGSQCKHIYFAACHDVGYISELTPYLGNSERFTLVRTTGVKFHPEFLKLGMNVEDFPGVFRKTPLADLTTQAGTPLPRSNSLGTVSATSGTNTQPTELPTRKPLYPATSQSMNGNGGTYQKTSKEDSNSVCQFHKVGKCRYGKSCKLVHLDEPDARLRLWTRAMPSASSDAHIPTWNGKPLNPNDVPSGEIPINKNNYRIDPYIPVSPEAMSKLRSRIKERPICNSYCLSGYCKDGKYCDFDHSELPHELIRPLEVLARSMPCSQRGACRLLGCTKGHTCQNPDCRQRDGKSPCKLPYTAHNEDLTVDTFVPGFSKHSDTTSNDYESENGDGVRV